MLRNFIILFSILVLFAGISSASTVSVDSFTKSCNTCSFDSSGKMDKACWEEIQDGAKVDLAVAYPGMSFKYQWGGGCKPLDQCIAALQSCNSLQTSGSDRTDCSQGNVIVCFKMADACAEAANKICSEGKDEDESGLNDIIKNMTTTKNDTSQGEPEDDVIVVSEDDPWGDLIGCLLGFSVIGFGALGAAFFSRN
jgi:hypothetical protein